MSTKKVLIIYRNHYFESIALAEKNYLKVVEDMVADGNEVKYKAKHNTVFMDGSTVLKMEFGESFKGMRMDEIYIDQSLLEMKNADTFVKEHLYPVVAFSDNGNNLEDRIKVFSKDGVKTIDKSK